MQSQIKTLHEKLQSGELKCEHLVREKLTLLEKNTHNTVVALLADTAIKSAKKVDEKITNGEKIGLLEGIPFGMKDVFMLMGTKTTAASHMLKNYNSSYTATAIEKLIDAGAIPIVKENCDAFGHGSSNENTIFNAAKNAHNPEKVAGGSSGSSAVNVAKGYTVFSIGGDTGGSIRQPAGYNQIYGLKPTYGKVSRYGLHAYTSSTDCVGPLAKSVEDICIVLNTISGKDAKDMTSIASDNIDFETVKKAPKKIRIGYFKSFAGPRKKDKRKFNVEDELRSIYKYKTSDDFLYALCNIEKKGAEIIPFDFAGLTTLVATYYTLAMAETASNLSRLDGSSYGSRKEGDTLKEGYKITRSAGFSKESKRRIVGGNQVLSAGFSEGIYQKALLMRSVCINAFKNHFKEVDVIISPVTPDNVPKIGEVMDDPKKMYLSDAYTVAFSLAKLPTLTIPKGTATGLQITANHLQEEKILRVANYLEEIL